MATKKTPTPPEERIVLTERSRKRRAVELARILEELPADETFETALDETVTVGEWHFVSANWGVRFFGRQDLKNMVCMTAMARERITGEKLSMSVFLENTDHSFEIPEWLGAGFVWAGSATLQLPGHKPGYSQSIMVRFKKPCKSGAAIEQRLRALHIFDIPR